jgi:VCBS repeat-containing protein
MDGDDMEAREANLAVGRTVGQSRRARRTRAVLLVLLLTLGSLVFPFPDSRRTTLRKLQPVVSIRASQGYWLVAADGGVFTFGDAKFLGPHRNQTNDIIGMARTPDGTGLWTVDDDGDVFHYGSAINYGSRLVDTNDIRGFAARPQGDGYWMVTKNGAVFSFGRAGFHGPFVPLNLSKLVVGMAATPSGNGYWVVARDGGIFSYGDADFYGSTGAIVLNQPIVGMATTPSGKGYWLVASDGGIFSFGDARFHGSTGAMTLNQPIVGLAPTGTGNGYWLIARDGGIFSFGDANFYGSTGGMTLNQPIVGMVPTRVIRSNDFPTAVPDSVTLDEDTPVTVNVLANDSGLTDAPITVSVLEGPSHGVATVGANGRITYTPAANYFGSDALTHVVVDADGDRSMATLNIAVTSRNDAPVAPDQALFTAEETAINGFLAASDADGDAKTYSVTSAPAHGTATVDPAGFFTYTPETDYNGNDTFIITVSDGRGGTDTVKIGISVGSLNDPPAAGDQSLSTAEETTVSGSVVATDPEGDAITYALTTFPTNGITTVDPISGAFTYTPGLNYTGADSFVITLDDGHGGTDTATISVTVTNANDLPVANDQTLSTNEDTVLTGGVGATDPDGDTLTYTVTGTPAHGSASVDSTGGFSYTPALNYAGPDTFIITVSDGQGGTDTATVNVAVAAVNDAPVAPDQTLSTTEDIPKTGSVSATDVDGDSLTYSFTQAPIHGSASIDAASGAFVYTPALDYVGSDSFVAAVSDGHGGFDTATVSLSVGGANDPPVTNDQSLSTNEDTPLNGSVPATDPDGDTLSYSVTNNAGHGTVSVNPNSGAFTYTPATDYNGPDSFTITVSDGQGGTDTATINMTVQPINDPPLAGGLSLSVNVDTVLVGSIDATDADGDPLTYTKTGEPAHGSVTVDASGGFTYTPDTGYIGTDSFTITVSDGQGGTDTATIAVLVLAI